MASRRRGQRWQGARPIDRGHHRIAREQSVYFKPFRGASAALRDEAIRAIDECVIPAHVAPSFPQRGIRPSMSHEPGGGGSTERPRILSVEDSRACHRRRGTGADPSVRSGRSGSAAIIDGRHDARSRAYRHAGAVRGTSADRFAVLCEVGRRAADAGRVDREKFDAVASRYFASCLARGSPSSRCLARSRRTSRRAAAAWYLSAQYASTRYAASLTACRRSRCTSRRPVTRSRSLPRWRMNRWRRFGGKPICPRTQKVGALL